MITLKLTDNKNNKHYIVDESVDICFWNFLETNSDILENIVFIEYTDDEWDRDMVTNKPYWSEFHAVAFRKKYKDTESAFKSGVPFIKYLKGEYNVSKNK